MAILSGLVLRKYSNTSSDNLFLCEMVLKRREGWLFSHEESFRVEDLVIGFFADVEEEKEYWEGLGRKKVEDWKG